MDYETLIYEKEGEVGILTYNRPRTVNAVNKQMLEELYDFWIARQRDFATRVIIVTGAGEKGFCSGLDMKAVATEFAPEGGPTGASTWEGQIHFSVIMRLMRSCPQPVIAAVGGAAIAGGFDLTLMCDIRYASEKAKFGQREIVLTLNPLLDPLWRIIGLGAARELALTGRIIDAAEAFRLGYVSKVFPTGEVVESVTKIAREMAAYDRDCLAETKQLSISVLDQSMDTAMKTLEWLFRTYIGAQDNKDRIEALQEMLKKRGR